jgi:hypothetical protein
LSLGAFLGFRRRVEEFPLGLLPVLPVETARAPLALPDLVGTRADQIFVDDFHRSLPPWVGMTLTKITIRLRGVIAGALSMKNLRRLWITLCLGNRMFVARGALEHRVVATFNLYLEL